MTSATNQRWNHKSKFKQIFWTNLCSSVFFFSKGINSSLFWVMPTVATCIVQVYFEGNNTYSSLLLADRATEIIAQHNPETPLFLYLPFQVWFCLYLQYQIAFPCAVRAWAFGGSKGIPGPLPWHQGSGEAAVPGNGDSHGRRSWAGCEEKRWRKK